MPGPLFRTSRNLAVVILCFLPLCRLVAGSDRCALCGALFTDKVYTVTDRVTEEKKQICEQCLNLPKTCFRCGLPVKQDYTELPDGRVLCARDVKDAVLEEAEAKQIISDVQSSLDRLFSRFASFPSTNVETAVVDRVNLQALLALPGGHDYVCPNVLGYTQSSTNHGNIEHKISLMSGLDRAALKAVCAHELSHAWVFENIAPERRKTLGTDAHEGFCELVAFLLMDAQGDEETKQRILQNLYTRGQIHLFIETEQRYGFNDVLEWMKGGEDALLRSDDLTRIHNLRPQPSLKNATNLLRPVAAAPARSAPPVTGAKGIVLKGVTWTSSRPLCVINDHTFELNEQRQIRVSGTNLLIRCLAIRQTGARIRIASSGEERDLALESR